MYKFDIKLIYIAWYITTEEIRKYGEIISEGEIKYSWRQNKPYIFVKKF